MPAHFQSRIILGGLVIVMLAGIYYAFFANPTPACPADARRCSDGTYVGRVGTKCEFADCPTGTTVVTDGPLGTVTGQVLLGSTGYAGVVEARLSGGNTAMATGQSNESGIYLLKLPPGNYQVTARGSSGTISCTPASVVVKSDSVATANVACKTTTASGKPLSIDVSARINETVTAGSLRITPVSVLEDSRCPTGTQCIQAGTVRMKATIQGTSGTSERTLELGIPVTTDVETITLIGVYPGRTSGKTIATGDYQFTLHVASR